MGKSHLTCLIGGLMKWWDVIGQHWSYRIWDLFCAEVRKDLWSKEVEFPTTKLILTLWTKQPVMAGILMGKKLCKYCGIWARPTHEELHITTYGCMLCPGDSKTNPYQCSSLITARLHGLLKQQNENTYFKSATNDKPRRLSGGAPLLPGWQEGVERIPKPTVIVRR